MDIRVLIADDHKIVREGLRTLLEKQPGFTVVAEAEDGKTAVRLAHQHSPDVAIMDVTMPELNGIEAARRITGKNPRIKVIVLSMHSDRRFVIEALRAGAAGYLLKDSAFEELARAIRSVLRGQSYLSTKITDIVVKDYISQVAQSDDSAEKFSSFSDFQNVLAPSPSAAVVVNEAGATSDAIAAMHACAGQIASQLNVSTKTIETYRQQMMEKLNLHSVAELTKYAIREGLTSL